MSGSRKEVKALRTKLAFLVLLASQIALFLGAVGRESWWDGP